ncbi:MarR family winged helix-turn-helix transcriptional regulator [Subtercola sp. YIM 133946]|uniref:MarR family winged helix-turn-helix transcriptional regulator n=1 Tax=Subtercola sp. YIM 133946 TaxID=3118909 RepID=UPI002F953B83
MTKRTSAVVSVEPETLELMLGVPVRLNRLFAATLGGLDPRLTFRQYRTLQRVANGYTSLSQLAARGSLSLPTVSENVDGLVKRGLMTTVQSAADRRAIILSVTDEGRAAVGVADEALRDIVQHVMADIPAETLPIVVTAMQSMYQRATVYFNEKGDADS